MIRTIRKKGRVVLISEVNSLGYKFNDPENLGFCLASFTKSSIINVFMYVLLRNKK